MLTSYNGFYTALLDNIAPGEIEKQLKDLYYQYSATNVLQEAELIGHGESTFSFSKNYMAKHEELKTASPWTYVNSLTTKSSYISFDEGLLFRQSLILRLPVHYFASWVDKLHWTVLQDISLRHLRDVDKTEQFIETIITKENEWSTNIEYLMLLSLERYYELLIDISRNLYALAFKENYYYDKAILEKVTGSAQLQYQQWQEQEMVESIKKIFGYIFDSNSVCQSKYFNSIFEWIYSKDREFWITNPLSVPTLKCIDSFHLVFYEKLRADNAVKLQLVRYANVENFNWMQAKAFVQLYAEDESDKVYEKLLIDFFKNYLQSGFFKWNASLAYNDEIINHAYYFAYLLTKEPFPTENIQLMFSKYRVWHEGWNYNSNWPIELLRKELYVLMAGIAVAYIQFNNKDAVEARKSLKKMLTLTVNQLRSSTVSFEHYLIPLQFIVHVQLKFDISAATYFITFITEKIDRFEIWLPLAVYCIDLFEKNDQEMDEFGKNVITQRIGSEIWFFESQYKNSLLEPKRADYLQLKKKSLAFYNSNKIGTE